MQPIVFVNYNQKQAYAPAAKITDITALIAPDLLKAGMVTDAKWVDYDKDGKPDLVLTGDYMPIRLFHATKHAPLIIVAKNNDTIQLFTQQKNH